MDDSSPSVREPDRLRVGSPPRLRADGHGRDRQVLVVGDGITGAVTAGFLDQAGLDPVLVPETNPETPPGPVVVWEPGLRVLERIGLRRPVERIGRPLNTLDCLTTGQSWDADGIDDSPLIAADRDQLADLLDQRLLNRIRVVDGAVTGIDSTDTGVHVSLADIEEPFDAVATTTKAISSRIQRQDPPATVHRWAFEWPASLPHPDRATEAWTTERAAFAVSSPSGTWGYCVSTADTVPPSVVDVDELGSRFGDLLPGTPFSALDNHALQYRQLTHQPSTELIDDRVAFVGPAVAAPLPGDALGPTLGIEDAWVLADSLAYGPADIETALADYESRRRQRRAAISAITDSQTSPARVETELSPALRQLCRTRTVAFSHVLDRPLPEAIRRTVDGL